MLSRSGLSTIPQFLCFQQSSESQRRKRGPNANLEKIYDYDDEQLDLTAFKKEYDEIQEK
jgi:hypothetical protein